MKFSVTKDGVPLTPSLYTWDEGSKTFSSEEDGLVLDFNNLSGITFKTGSDCAFYAGSNCTFYTGSNCVVNRRDIFQLIHLLDNRELSFKKDVDIFFDGIKISLDEYNELLKVREI